MENLVRRRDCLTQDRRPKRRKRTTSLWPNVRTLRPRPLVLLLPPPLNLRTSKIHRSPLWARGVRLLRMTRQRRRRRALSVFASWSRSYAGKRCLRSRSPVSQHPTFTHRTSRVPPLLVLRTPCLCCKLPGRNHRLRLLQTRD